MHIPPVVSVSSNGNRMCCRNLISSPRPRRDLPITRNTARNHLFFLLSFLILKFARLNAHFGVYAAGQGLHPQNRHCLRSREDMLCLLSYPVRAVTSGRGKEQRDSDRCIGTVSRSIISDPGRRIRHGFPAFQNIS